MKRTVKSHQNQSQQLSGMMAHMTRQFAELRADLGTTTNIVPASVDGNQQTDAFQAPRINKDLGASPVPVHIRLPGEP